MGSGTAGHGRGSTLGKSNKNDTMSCEGKSTKVWCTVQTVESKPDNGSCKSSKLTGSVNYFRLQFTHLSFTLGDTIGFQTVYEWLNRIEQNR